MVSAEPEPIVRWIEAIAACASRRVAVAVCGGAVTLVEQRAAAASSWAMICCSSSMAGPMAAAASLQVRRVDDALQARRRLGQAGDQLLDRQGRDLVQDRGRRGLQRLQRRRHRGDDRDRPAGVELGRRRVRREGQVDEQLAGQQVAGLQLRPQPALHELRPSPR